MRICICVRKIAKAANGKNIYFNVFRKMQITVPEYAQCQMAPLEIHNEDNNKLTRLSLIDTGLKHRLRIAQICSDICLFVRVWVCSAENEFHKSDRGYD